LFVIAVGLLVLLLLVAIGNGSVAVAEKD